MRIIRQPLGEDVAMTLPPRPDELPPPPDDPSVSVLVLELAAVVLALAVPLPVTPLVPLLVIGSVSLWVRGRGWGDVGLRADDRVWTYAGLGVALGVVAMLADAWVLGPSLEVFANRTFELTGAPVRGHLAVLASALVLSVALAMGVEMVFRGYVFDRLERLLGSPEGAGPGLPVLAAAFAYAWFVGDGRLGSVLGGLAFGVGYALLYLAARRNLVLPIAFHFAFEATNLVLLYLRAVG